MPIAGNGRFDLIRSLLQRAQESVGNGIQQSSKRTYGTGIRRWMTFVELFGTDPFMRTIPPEFSRYQTGEGAFHHTSWQEACFMGFLEWLQSPPKPIAPASAANYLDAVKHHLVCHGLDMSNQVSSTVLSKQKKGNMSTFLADEHNLEANRRTQPLSVDILMGERPLLGTRNPL